MYIHHKLQIIQKNIECFSPEVFFSWSDARYKYIYTLHYMHTYMYTYTNIDIINTCTYYTTHTVHVHKHRYYKYYYTTHTVHVHKHTTCTHYTICTHTRTQT